MKNPPSAPRHVRLDSAEHGDFRYYHRLFNFSFVWNLQHAPRQRLFDCFMRTLHPTESDSVLDLGTTALPEPQENFFELYYPHKHRIVAVGTEDCSFLEEDYEGLRFRRVEAAQPLPFADDAFDIGFSNAVIEHAGTREKQAFFLRELVRVTRRCFLATPNRWFPVELHTRLPLLHWLPAPVFRAIISALGFSFYAREENLNLLTAPELLAMVPPGDYREVALRYNRFMGLPSNLILVVTKTGSLRPEGPATSQ
jgi:SAM-dependent methyltransferase